MGKEQFSVIPGSKASGKTTLILFVMLALVLSLQGLILSDLLSYLAVLDLSLCDLRRKLERKPLDVRDLKFMGTVSLTPAQRPTDAYVQPPQAEERTENT